jgi:predicted MPP superfamily phosphohydrolase
LLNLSATWLGIAWISLVVLIAHDVLLLIFRYPTNTSRWFAIGLITVLSVYSMVNACWIEIKTIRLKAPVEMKIIQLSDVHLGSVGQAHLRRLVRKVSDVHPDLVLITGDLVDPGSHLEPDALKALSSMNMPVYWVTGNHERYAGLEKVEEMVSRAGVVSLRNKVVDFKGVQLIGDFKGVQLIGIDDSDDRKQVETFLPMLSYDRGAYNILMYHQPEGFEYAAGKGVDLMLSGHTHNGQIFPFNAFVRMRFQCIKGLYEKDGAFLYVSPGSGWWGPPMRLGSRPQITVIELNTE